METAMIKLSYTPVSMLGGVWPGEGKQPSREEA
jgi:hypothetical protein